jgi:hypothetical protein
MRSLWLLVCLSVYSKTIEDCGIEARVLSHENDQRLHGLLAQLRKTTFFRIFKVNLHSECLFWDEQAMCERRGCSVCTCEDDEVPGPFRVSDQVDRSIQLSFHKWNSEDRESWNLQDQFDDKSTQLIRWAA